MMEAVALCNNGALSMRKIFGEECSVCCYRALTVRSRCLKCSAQMCDACLAKYLTEHPNVLKVACPFCENNWYDAEAIAFASNKEFVNETWRIKVTEMLAARISPRYDAFVQGMLSERKRERLRDVQHALDTFKSRMDEYADKVFNVLDYASTSNLGLMEDMSDIRRYTTKLVENAVDNVGLSKDRLMAMMEETDAAEFDARRKFKCLHCVEGVVIYASDGRCGKCFAQHCKFCEVLLDVKAKYHVCDSQTLQNVNEIQQSSKPCPTCATMITRDSGCDEMFCTKCASTFSWKTGFHSTPRHNPERTLYEKKEKGKLQREFGDIECGGVDKEDLGDGIKLDVIENAYNMYDMLYDACVEWNKRKREQREKEMTTIIAAYAKRMNKETRDERLPELQSVIRRQNVSKKYASVLPASRRDDDLDFGYEDDPPKLNIGLVSKHRFADVRKRLADDLMPGNTRKFNSLLYEIEKMNEAEDKYYDNVLTYVRCLSYILKNYAAERDEIQRGRDGDGCVKIIKRKLQNVMTRFQQLETKFKEEYLNLSVMYNTRAMQIQSTYNVEVMVTVCNSPKKNDGVINLVRLK